jgi:hypothetical protein
MKKSKRKRDPKIEAERLRQLLDLPVLSEPSSDQIQKVYGVADDLVDQIQKTSNSLTSAVELASLVISAIATTPLTWNDTVYAATRSIDARYEAESSGIKALAFESKKERERGLVRLRELDASVEGQLRRATRLARNNILRQIVLDSQAPSVDLPSTANVIAARANSQMSDIFDGDLDLVSRSHPVLLRQLSTARFQLSALELGLTWQMPETAPRALLVGPKVPSRLLAERILQKRGFAWIAAEFNNEAFELLGSEKFDLVYLYMGSDEIEFLDKIRYTEGLERRRRQLVFSSSPRYGWTSGADDVPFPLSSATLRAWRLM